MDRRSVLAAVAASVPAAAGCAGVVGEPARSTAESDRDGNNLADRADFPLQSGVGDIAVTSVAQPSTLDAAVAVGVARGVSDAHPPQIGAVFENTGDKRRTVRFGSTAPLSSVTDRGPSDALALQELPYDGTYERDGCWVVDRGAETLPLLLAELDPGETIANRLDLLSTSSAAAGPHCLPTGSFAFEQSFRAEGSGVEDSFEFTVEIG